MNDDSIRTLVTRLARPHRSGGVVIERAAVLAEGADFTAVMNWIVDRGGVAEEAAVAAASNGGLHGTRLNHGGAAQPPLPLRFVLPPGALTEPALT
jgi:hypothetical protein